MLHPIKCKYVPTQGIWPTLGLGHNATQRYLQKLNLGDI